MRCRRISDRSQALALSACLAVFLATLAAPAHAQSATFQMPVGVQVINGCQITTITGVNFGDIAAVPLMAPVDAEGRIRVRCRANTRVTLTLSPGQHHNGSTRRMARTVGATTYFLEYQLYENAAHTRVFVSDTRMVPRVPGHQWRVHGLIPAGAGTQAGTGLHTDTVVVTATF